MLFVDEQVTSRLVEQALPLVPMLHEGESQMFFSYDELARKRQQRVDEGNPHDGHTSPENWYAALAGPLRETVEDIKHKQVYEALCTVVFSDREGSPWGKATAQAQDWLFGPDEDIDPDKWQPPRPTDTVAATVLLVAVYGDDARYLLHLIP
ncbi:hypothetical protein [Streptomyces harbinensis]|uniref:hypothetical protein n=1 Tax=Streptomyces harbinensis TaxID=1176198 RepID=UPI0034DE3BB1